MAKTKPSSILSSPMLIRVAFLLTPILLLPWIGYKLYDTAPNNQRILAQVRVSPDISLDLIAIPKPGDPPLKLTTSLTFVAENIPKFVSDLKYPWVQSALRKFRNRHSSHEYRGNMYNNTITCFFLLRCNGHNNISGYVPVREAESAFKKLRVAGGSYLLSDAFSFYQGIHGIDLQQADESPWGSAVPLVLKGRIQLDDLPKKQVGLWIGKNIVMRYPGDALPLITIDNPFYREVVPLKVSSPFPVSLTHDGITVTIKDFQTPIEGFPRDHLPRLTYLDQARTGTMPLPQSGFNFTGLVTQVHQADSHHDWKVHTVKFSAGENRVPLQMDPDAEFLNFEHNEHGPLQFHTFQGTPDYLNQPIRVSITLRRITRFAPYETNTVDIALPLPKSDSITTTLIPGKIPVKAAVQLGMFWPKDHRHYRDKTYLQFGITNPEWTIDDYLHPVLTHKDGTTISLKSYQFERGGNTAYYDIYRHNYPDALPPALKLDDYTTITVGVPKKVIHPETFEFIISPRKPNHE